MLSVKNTWRRTVEGELKNLHHTWGSIKKPAQNRLEWRSSLLPYMPAGIKGRMSLVCLQRNKEFDSEENILSPI